MATRQPMRWPDGWPRATATEYTGQKFGGIDAERAERMLIKELKRAGATDVVIASNINHRTPRDLGVALYFTRKGKQISLACDRFDTIAGNIRSIGLAIEGLRQLERHGGDHMMDKAFEGFAALPSPERPWAEVLGFLPEEVQLGLLKIDIESQYRRKAARIHAEAGGDRALRDLNVARDQALAAMAKGSP